MSVTLHELGNRVGLRLPKPLLEQLGLKAGSEVDVKVEGNCLVIEPAHRRRYTMAELLEGFTPDNRPGEADWGKPVGGEVWLRLICLVRSALIRVIRSGSIWIQTCSKTCRLAAGYGLGFGFGFGLTYSPGETKSSMVAKLTRWRAAVYAGILGFSSTALPNQYLAACRSPRRS